MFYIVIIVMNILLGVLFVIFDDDVDLVDGFIISSVFLFITTTVHFIQKVINK
jgi:hypothetical protein